MCLEFFSNLLFSGRAYFTACVQIKILLSINPNGGFTFQLIMN